MLAGAIALVRASRAKFAALPALSRAPDSFRVEDPVSGWRQLVRNTGVVKLHPIGTLAAAARYHRDFGTQRLSLKVRP